MGHLKRKMMQYVEVTNKSVQEVIDAIKDTTGAGDAFWTGFLFGQITYKSVEESIKLAQKLAAIKLQSIGQLPEDFKVEDLVV